MKAAKAKAKAFKFCEPTSLEDVIYYIRKHAKIGYRNCSVEFDKEPLEIESKLKELGYETHIESFSSHSFLLSIDW